MKRVLFAVAALCLCEAAVAETPAALKVRTWDIDLSSEKGVDHLADRMLRRMWDICGWPQDAGLTYALTGAGKVEREACKAKLTVSRNAEPGVQAAFRQALERF
jgi:UrcA family protein